MTHAMIIIQVRDTDDLELGPCLGRIVLMRSFVLSGDEHADQLHKDFRQTFIKNGLFL